ncbi:neuropeptide FF receptor 1-like [Orbicella faveolata]|uniref:neuropeptide FF receptor 1-like n=1 Tax=Orbicella faveolata TaxID=48498 RepID=UPI0009E42D7A|nr:neuropeptide FF receptor 1-like [Orbicella faveolata]
MSENVNTTMNGTQPSSCPSASTAEKIGSTFAYCLIFIVSLTGNTVIGIIVYKTKTMRKPINFFIVNMATSDLLHPIIVIPRRIQELYIDSWLIGGPLGQALCKLIVSLADLSATVSIQSLVLIAVDRFGAVVFPLRSPLISSKLCPFFILATWIVAIAVSSPELFAFKLVEYPRKLVCERHWNEVFGESSSFENYLLSFTVVFMFIPLVLITIIYIIIYLKLKSQKIPGAQSANAGQRRQQRERNVLKMAVAIVLGCAVCWLPLAIFWFILVLTDINILPNCGVPYFLSVVYFMASANSAVNPCICFIFSSNYRKELKALLR